MHLSKADGGREFNTSHYLQFLDQTIDFIAFMRYSILIVQLDTCFALQNPWEAFFNLLKR